MNIQEFEENVFKGVEQREKYQTNNFISKYLLTNFISTILGFAKKTGVKKIHEIGCGEGHISGFLAKSGFDVRGCDISENSLEVAKASARKANLKIDFSIGSIYDLDYVKDSEELVVCCEVLEHLDDPEKGLEMLSKVANPYLILSVPNEPLWSILNILRGKYLSSRGNTPGHIQRWSTSKFLNMVNKYANIIEVKRPIPWTVLLCKIKK